jgi:hypothetical protein
MTARIVLPIVFFETFLVKKLKKEKGIIMKTIFALVTALCVGSAFADMHVPSELKASTSPTAHMFEFNADSVLQGVLSLNKSKTKGTGATNDAQLNLHLNYAYSLANMPRLQLGGRLDYGKGTQAGRGHFEDYGFQVGAILNHSTDLMNSYYASLYLGLGWDNTYGNSGYGNGKRDEVFSKTLAVGKRIALHRYFGINHVVYSPEIALQSLNSTTGAALQYSQNIQFRFLQFSVFF